jgi:hypothetical protein
MYYSCHQCLLKKSPLYDIWNWYTMHSLYHLHFHHFYLLNSNSGSRGNHEGEILKTRQAVHERDKHDGNLNKSSIRVQGLHVSRITRHVSNTLRSPDTNSYVHGSLKGSSNSKCVDESLDKTRYLTRTDSKRVLNSYSSCHHVYPFHGLLAVFSVFHLHDCL